VHPEFAYFCPTPRWRRQLRVVVVSILFGAIIGASVATLGAGHDGNAGSASTTADVDLSSAERVSVVGTQAAPAATNVAKTKGEASEPIKAYPIRRVRVRPATANPSLPAVDPTAATQAAVVASATGLLESPGRAQSSGAPTASSHATAAAPAPRPTAVKKRQAIVHVQSHRRNDERADYSGHGNRRTYRSGRTSVDDYDLRSRYREGSSGRQRHWGWF
jgi:hypothetical protein